MNLDARLFEARIEGRKTWGLYVDLIAQIRKKAAAERQQRIDELRQRHIAALTGSTTDHEENE